MVFASVCLFSDLTICFLVAVRVADHSRIPSVYAHTLMVVGFFVDVQAVHPGYTVAGVEESDLIEIT